MSVDVQTLLASDSSLPRDRSIERIYQKKTQLEHILIRPDTYIGSVEQATQEMWIIDDSDPESVKMTKKTITFVPGLYKIFDEILVNAADNKQRDPNMTTIRVEINEENNLISVFNDGKGIPVTIHKKENMYVPTLIFGHLLTSSNFDDNERKVTGGRNGYGAKLCNVFSTEFTVETSTQEFNRSFKQTWKKNMSSHGEPVISAARKTDFTKISFKPDLEKFKLCNLDNDIVALFKRRVWDIAASTRGVRVYLNGKLLPIKSFEDYVNLFIKDHTDEANQPLRVVYQKFGPRWEVAVTSSDCGFQQMSFVNSIATTKGGKHIDYVADQIVTKLIETIKKKNKTGSEIRPHQVKNHMWVFVNCLIENPTFDSQTKEFMTVAARSFGSKCEITDDFVKKIKERCGIVDSVLRWFEYKQKAMLEKKGGGSKTNKLKGIAKLDDANDAGTKNSLSCTLIVTEGDSAKTLAVSGLAVVGRDKYGIFPLRGKLLNVREATSSQIMNNAEITNLCKILGLQYREKYETREKMKQLRYGKLMIMADQDHDGSHIKGLVINFIHHNWPNLLKYGFIEEFITPIVKAFRGNRELLFYSMPEFEEWQNKTEDWMRWRIKYYKGLGTSSSKEAKEYFNNMTKHKIGFSYGGARDDLALKLAFSKNLADDRKEWLCRFMEERRRRREESLPEDYLYRKDTKTVNYVDFVNKELILFSNLDNERSIPSLVDGFKPGQRKIMYVCFKRNIMKEIKVAQLVGSVAELSAYHHGEQSLMGTIINLAQDFVGSNNLNLLLPIGQFGTRIMGGKDAASARYIFTALNPLTRFIFSKLDDPVLNYLNDDGMLVEPEWYCPIIPMALVNGAEGIGTGWATKVPNYNPREIISNLRRMLKKEQPLPMLPYYKNFRGTIQQPDETKVLINGEISIIDENTLEITELPIGTWTQFYKDTVLEPLMTGSTPSSAPNDNKKTEKAPVAPLILDYKDYSTDTTVRFVIKVSNSQMQQIRQQGFHKVFKLQKSFSMCNLVLFDAAGCLKKYNNILEILAEFVKIRLAVYDKRKTYMMGLLSSEALRLDNMARFIVEKIEGKIKVENVKRVVILSTLKERNYDPDPVKAWKKSLKTVQMQENNDEEDDDGAKVEASDYDYLLGMPIWSLTLERKEDLLEQQKKKAKELNDLRSKTVEQLWIEDLDNLIFELDKFELKEQDEKKKGKGSKVKFEMLPSANGQRVEPPAVDLEKIMLEKIKKRKVQEKAGSRKIVDALMNEDASESFLAAKITENAKMKPLSERIKSNKNAPDNMKQTSLNIFCKPVKNKANNSSSSVISLSSDDANLEPSLLEESPPAKRELPTRNAAKKVQYLFDDEGDEDTGPKSVDALDDVLDEIVGTKERSDSSDSEVYKPKERRTKPAKSVLSKSNRKEDKPIEKHTETKETAQAPAKRKGTARKSTSKPASKKVRRILESDSNEDAVSDFSIDDGDDDDWLE